jgi:hypothetical protein
MLGHKDLDRREGGRHDNLGRHAVQGGDRGLRGCEAHGIRGRLSRGGRGSARVARKVAAERRLAHIRAREFARAGIRIPLRVPRSAAHGDNSGASVPRVRHGRHNHRSQRVVSHYDHLGRGDGGAQPVGIARDNQGGEDRGALYPRPDNHQVGFPRCRHKALHRQARRDEESEFHYAGSRGDQFRHAAVGDRVRFLRQAEEHF